MNIKPCYLLLALLTFCLTTAKVAKAQIAQTPNNLPISYMINSRGQVIDLTHLTEKGEKIRVDTIKRARIIRIAKKNAELRAWAAKKEAELKAQAAKLSTAEAAIK